MHRLTPPYTPTPHNHSIGRLLLAAKHDFLPKSESGGGAGPDLAQTLLQSPRFERFAAWWGAVTARPSWKTTFDETALLQAFEKRFGTAPPASV